jgi:hypothetical protein
MMLINAANALADMCYHAMPHHSPATNTVLAEVVDNHLGLLNGSTQAPNVHQHPSTQHASSATMHAFVLIVATQS